MDQVRADAVLEGQPVEVALSSEWHALATMHQATAAKASKMRKGAANKSAGTSSKSAGLAASPTRSPPAAAGSAELDSAPPMTPPAAAERPSSLQATSYSSPGTDEASAVSETPKAGTSAAPSATPLPRPPAMLQRQRSGYLERRRERRDSYAANPEVYLPQHQTDAGTPVVSERSTTPPQSFRSAFRLTPTLEKPLLDPPIDPSIAIPMEPSRRTDRTVSFRGGTVVRTRDSHEFQRPPPVKGSLQIPDKAFRAGVQPPRPAPMQPLEA